MTLPLVSIVTPTRDRPRFLEQCQRYVERQTYPVGLLEWVIVDSSERYRPANFERSSQVAVRWIECRGSLGHLHNVANAHARGQIIVHFDDDDWHAPDRVEKQVSALLSPGVELVCTDDYYVFFGPGRGSKSWSWGRDLFSSGGTFAYWRSTWQRNRFPALQLGEDQCFAKMIRITGRARNLRDPSFFAYIRHAQNTCSFVDDFTRNAGAEGYELVAKLLGSDLDFYEESHHGAIN